MHRILDNVVHYLPDKNKQENYIYTESTNSIHKYIFSEEYKFAKRLILCKHDTKSWQANVSQFQLEFQAKTCLGEK